MTEPKPLCMDCQRTVDECWCDMYDPEAECSWCGGEGINDCTDGLECFDPDCDGDMCRCGSCNGSGLAKDQRVW